MYPVCLLRQTMHLLEQKQEILVPEEVAQLVADAYDSSKVPQQELDAWMGKFGRSRAPGRRCGAV